MQLKADKREILGSKVKNLRANKLIPAVLFAPKKDSISIQVDYNSFIKIYREAGETEVVDVMVGETKYPVIVEEVQYHPVSSLVMHVNFRVVDLKQKIKVNVPIVFVNEETHPLLKNENAILLTIMNEVEVEALPKDLPKEIVIDVNTLKEIGDTVTIKDLEKLIDTSKVEMTVEDKEQTVATLDYAQQQEETVEEEPKSVEDVEITTEKKEEPGDKKEEEKK